MTAQLRVAGHNVRVYVFNQGVIEDREGRVVRVPFQLKELPDGSFDLNVDGSRGVIAAVESAVCGLARVFEEADAILSRHPFATTLYVPAAASTVQPSLPHPAELPFAGDVD